MIRGTNAEFRFKLPYDYDEIAAVQIVFWQDNNDGPSKDRPLPIYKAKSQCLKGDTPNILCVILHQEETLRFTEKRKAKVQLRATTTTGTPIACKERLITVYPVYDDSVLDDVIPTTPSYDGLIILDGQNIIEGEW